MPLQHERENCARDRHTATKLRDIATEVGLSRNLIEAAFMAAHNLEQHERDPLVELLAVISDRLKTVAAEIVTQADITSQKETTDAA